MLEGLATWVLNNYLGQYLENVNADQLSIGLLKGEVELENVPLRKDALQHFDLALDVHTGFVGKVKLQIPVTRLRSEPWIIAFEQLYLVAGPIDLNCFDEEAEKIKETNKKVHQLDSIEATWRTTYEKCTGQSSESSYSSWIAYGSSFVTNIVENIQLKIKDVHIRFEDDQSIPGTSFAFGLTIDSLSVQSSDQHWVPKFIYASEKNISYKLLELKKFAFYLDTSTVIYKSKSYVELAQLMLSSTEEFDHEYILKPVSVTACLKCCLSSSPLRSRNSPRFTCDLKLDALPLYLNDTQFSQIIASLKYYDRIETALPYRKWRPKCKTYKNNVKYWWKYAYECICHKVNYNLKSRNWVQAFEKAKKLNKYTRIYLEYLRNPITINTELREYKMEYEVEMNFEELRSIREICMEKMRIVIGEKKTDESPKLEVVPSYGPAASESAGVLQRWFPAWTGWYSQEEQIAFSEEFSSENSVKKEETPLTLEEEILYVISDSMENNTFTKRDAVFAQLCFSLKQGSFTLSQSEDNKSQSLPLFKLEFSEVKIAFELRPRNQSFSFDVELGNICLEDKFTTKTAFPLLISQQRDNSTLAQKVGVGRTTSGVYARLSSMIYSVSGLPSQQKNTKETAGPLFSLFYEKKPKNIKFEHKLVITSQALDIVYNQNAFKSIQDFFHISSMKKDENQIFRTWTSSARKRYEEIKQHTKEEFKKNFETMMQGAANIERKRWDVHLDISAPQLIIPEHFEDSNATVVVLDFGKLSFHSVNLEKDKTNSSQDDDSDDDDNFATPPCSTPEEFTLKEELERKNSNSQEFMSETNLHEHIYDKYDLNLSDLQVMVAKVRDNWRFAYQKGTGPIHVLDKFNINIHLERQILPILTDYSSEIRWPSLVLSGSIPQLVIHINEQKVRALSHFCNSLIFSPKQQSPMSPKDEHKESYLSKIIPRSETLTSINAEQESSELSKLLVMQFSVDKLSLELQSRGRSIVELQVTGVKAKLSKTPIDFTVLLTVHSLLLVDALQTFGPDFELLVASHKHISMDSVSGSLLDSEPCSPTSPASPDCNVKSNPTSPLMLSQALSSLAVNRATSPLGDRFASRSPPILTSPNLPHLQERDTEALIILEMKFVSSTEQINSVPELISSVQFNALDVIANQETVVELVGFIHQMVTTISSDMSSGHSAFKSPSNYDFSDRKRPPDKDETISKASFYGSIASLYPPENMDQTTQVEISFDFHKLTILLLRESTKDKEIIGRKVGTAVLSDAKICASIVSDTLTVEGSLGGFQIRDVTPEGNKHQCIVSVGHDPIVEKSQDLVHRLNSGVYQSVADQIKEVAHEAFRFKVIRPIVLPSPEEEYLDVYSTSDYRMRIESPKPEKKLKIEMRLASVVYTHSPQFLSEIKSCATEFKRYITQVCQSIKQAATEVAIGLVSKRIESFVSMSHTALRDSPKLIRHMTYSKSTETLLFPNPPPASTLESSALSPIHSVAPDLAFNTEMDLIFETPIVVLPEACSSASVIVAHLGRISINNKEETGNAETNIMAPSTKSASFKISVKDMSLYSLNVDERLRSRDITFHPQMSIIAPLSTTMMCAEELYSCKDHGFPILYNASLELVMVQKREDGMLSDYEAGLVFPSDIWMEHQSDIKNDSFTIEGGFITPLKVSLSRNQYQQISRTMDNIYLPSLKNHSSSLDLPSLDPIYENTSTVTGASSEISSEKERSFIPVKGKFTIPSLCVELRGDVGASAAEQPMVNLVLEQITALHETTKQHETTTQITLVSLLMEDLQCSAADSTNHYLMKSETSEVASSVPMVRPTTACSSRQFLSTSCPELKQDTHSSVLSTSLPSKLERKNPFLDVTKKSYDHSMHSKEGAEKYQCYENKDRPPFTPPPSPSADPDDFNDRFTNRDGALVNVQIHNIGEKHPEFLTKYDGNHRFVDVCFNRLVTVINLESWVMLLDFFRTSVAEEKHRKDQAKKRDTQNNFVPQDSKSLKVFNTVFEINLRCLALVF